ncbi:alpha/beta hydrolase [Candidatus Woesearchaeota archaeon]|nr:alpha/beta hydrolase [Candidatus Woesearchaeota archaeon]
MGKKIQVLFIHGGMTFKNKKDYINFLKKRKVRVKEKIRWHGQYLKEKLGRNFEIIKPSMPLPENAKYSEWKIHFERFFPYLRNNIILIGSSLGGVFLAKYLSEHKFPRKIIAAYIICAPYDNHLEGEDLVGGFKLKSDLSLMEKNAKRLYILFSKNDDIVPIAHAKKYAKRLKNANIIVYKHIKGHFQITKFPEIIKMIKNDVKK